jgi:nitrite reductase/ring-hydroxylating ferredoxin subunit
MKDFFPIDSSETARRRFLKRATGLLTLLVGLSIGIQCPCHGSVYAADGRVLSGPAPRSLDTLPMQVQGG